MRLVTVLAVALAASVAVAAPTLTSDETSLEVTEVTEFYVPGQLIFEEVADFFYVGWSEDLQQYAYLAPLDQLVELAWGETYWISVRAVLAFPPQWGWCETDSLWNSEAVVRSAPMGIPNWTPWSQVVGHHVEMAFALYAADEWLIYAQPAVPGSTYYSSQWDSPAFVIDTEIADDFIWTDELPIGAVEWFGGYWNPGQPPIAESFIIRVYGNVISPVEQTTWGGIKALFR